jgi:hypothetical protein
VGIDPCILNIAPAFEPLAVTKKEAMRIVGMPKLVQRWLYHRWIEVVRVGGRGCETMIDYGSLKTAYYRYKKGETPPPLPSELVTKTKIPSFS